jgi:hypothetical protein
VEAAQQRPPANQLSHGAAGLAAIFAQGVNTMSESLQRLKFFCLTHQEPCVAERSNPLPLCEQGHRLSEDFLRDKWEYCCGCQCFFKRHDHEPARGRCPSCDRAILARYLCHQCDTLSFEAELPPPQRDFSFSVAGAPQPNCPCCLTTAPELMVKHDCADALHVLFRTARTRCPFCGRSLGEKDTPSEVMPTPPLTGDLASPLVKQNHPLLTFPPGFRRPVSEYLQRMDGKAIIARPLPAQPHVLTESADGYFWLQRHQDETTFVVFPGTPRFGAEHEFARFQPIFDCDYPATGELVISAPAIARLDPATRTWTVTQKGKLEVQIGLAQTFTPPITTSPPAGDTATKSAPNNLNQSARDKRLRLLIGGGGVAMLLIGVAIYFLLFSPMRQIISKVKQGQIVTPAGNSAYDLFIRSNLSDSDRATLRQAITPLLEANGNEVIRKLVSEGYAPSVTDSDNTAKVFAWLDSLAPQNFYRARKHYFQGRAAFDRNDLNGAENEFRQAMTLDTGWAVPVNHMGRVAVKRRDYSSARTWYQRAIALDSTFTAPHSNLCVVEVENLRDYVSASQSCRNYIQLDQSKPAGYYFLGRALEEQGYKCDALREYQMALDKASRSTNTGGINLDSMNRRVNRLARQCGG